MKAAEQSAAFKFQKKGEILMAKTKIEIKTKRTDTSVFTEIYVDGRKLNGVRRYELKQEAGNEPILTVDLSAVDLAVDLEVLLMQQGVGGIKNIIFDDEPAEASPSAG